MAARDVVKDGNTSILVALKVTVWYDTQGSRYRECDLVSVLCLALQVYG